MRILFIGDIVGSPGRQIVSDLLADFPYLEEEDIREALSYAARLAQGREIQLAS